jgi:hypothetical protein
MQQVLVNILLVFKSLCSIRVHCQEISLRFFIELFLLSPINTLGNDNECRWKTNRGVLCISSCVLFITVC